MEKVLSSKSVSISDESSFNGYNVTIKKGVKVFGNLTIVYFQILNISIKSKRSYKKY
jgi:hypothetical protein